jgi:hypothetical protein
MVKFVSVCLFKLEIKSPQPLLLVPLRMQFSLGAKTPKVSENSAHRSIRVRISSICFVLLVV